MNRFVRNEAPDQALQGTRDEAAHPSAGLLREHNIMKPRTWTILIGVLSFLGGAVAGGVAGAYVAIDFVSGFFGDTWILGKGQDTRTDIAILQDIRNGRTERATELLEVTLDENIVSLVVSDRYAPKTNEIVGKAIQKAKEYRAQYPRQSQFPEIDQAVTKVLEQNAK